MKLKDYFVNGASLLTGDISMAARNVSNCSKENLGRGSSQRLLGDFEVGCASSSGQTHAALALSTLEDARVIDAVNYGSLSRERTKIVVEQHVPSSSVSRLKLEAFDTCRKEERGKSVVTSSDIAYNEGRRAEWVSLEEMCPRCTFINDSGDEMCEMCECPLGSTPIQTSDILEQALSCCLCDSQAALGNAFQKRKCEHVICQLCAFATLRRRIAYLPTEALSTLGDVFAAFRCPVSNCHELLDRMDILAVLGNEALLQFEQWVVKVLDRLFKCSANMQCTRCTTSVVYLTSAANIKQLRIARVWQGLQARNLPWHGEKEECIRRLISATATMVPSSLCLLCMSCDLVMCNACGEQMWGKRQWESGMSRFEAENLDMKTAMCSTHLCNVKQQQCFSFYKCVMQMELAFKAYSDGMGKKPSLLSRKNKAPSEQSNSSVSGNPKLKALKHFYKPKSGSLDKNVLLDSSHKLNKGYSGVKLSTHEACMENYLTVSSLTPSSNVGSSLQPPPLKVWDGSPSEWLSLTTAAHDRITPLSKKKFKNTRLLQDCYKNPPSQSIVKQPLEKLQSPPILIADPQYRFALVSEPAPNTAEAASSSRYCKSSSFTSSHKMKFVEIGKLDSQEVSAVDHGDQKATTDNWQPACKSKEVIVLDSDSDSDVESTNLLPFPAEMGSSLGILPPSDNCKLGPIFPTVKDKISKSDLFNSEPHTQQPVSNTSEVKKWQSFYPFEYSGAVSVSEFQGWNNSRFHDSGEAAICKAKENALAVEMLADQKMEIALRHFAEELKHPEPYFLSPVVSFMFSKNVLQSVLHQLIQNDSIMDITSRRSLYSELFFLLQVLMRHQELLPLLLSPISVSNVCYWSSVEGSILGSLGKLHAQAEVMLPEAQRRLDFDDEASVLDVILVSDIKQTFENLEERISEWRASNFPVDNRAFKDLTFSLETKDTPLSDGIQEDSADKNQPSVMEVAAYKERLKAHQFYQVNMLNRHYYRKQAVGNSTNRPRALRITKEIASLVTNLPCEWGSSIYLRTDEQRMDILKALIIGPEGTPYSNGVFLFDIFLPEDYPHSPPKVKFLTTGNGTVRFNPNLYNDGKVCLSLLGTWSGPGWQSSTSTILQVLVSIQSLILVAEPYYNEPGFVRMESRNWFSQQYNHEIQWFTVKHAIIDAWQNPDPAFQDVIMNHFKLKRKEVISQCELWYNETTDILKLRMRDALSILKGEATTPRSNGTHRKFGE